MHEDLLHYFGLFYNSSEFLKQIIDSRFQTVGPSSNSGQIFLQIIAN